MMAWMNKDSCEDIQVAEKTWKICFHVVTYPTFKPFKTNAHYSTVSASDLKICLIHCIVKKSFGYLNATRTRVVKHD